MKKGATWFLFSYKSINKNKKKSSFCSYSLEYQYFCTNKMSLRNLDWLLSCFIVKDNNFYIFS